MTLDGPSSTPIESLRLDDLWTDTGWVSGLAGIVLGQKNSEETLSDAFKVDLVKKKFDLGENKFFLTRKRERPIIK